MFKKLIKLLMGMKEIEFHVAGVTFKTGKKSRQALLRAMKFGDEPFGKVDITFERYDFDSELAIGVYANGQQIGNVPRELIQEFDKKWTNQYIVESWKVIGGNEKNYGCIVKVLFEK